MIDLFDVCRTKATDFFFGEDSLSPMELMYKIIEKLNEVIETVNSYTESIAEKVSKTEMVNDYKLDSTGNFTGKFAGNSVTEMLANIDSNEDQINYIAGQFSDGQTGFVIDGGFFIETGIDDNYNGGVF